jgi:uncharacterized delta-60 repeat protein
MGAGKQGWRSVARRWAGARFIIVTVLLGVASGALCGSAGAAAPVREWPAGALDPGFASGGVLSASFGTTAGPQEGRDAVIQPDGKIIVLTTSASADYLSRYLPDGEPDTTFGSGGTVTHPLNQNSFSALTLDAEGRIVVIGEESAPPWQDPDKTLEIPDRAYGVVYRFLPDGSPDSSFGMNGKTVIAVPPPESLTPGSASTYPSAVLTASDGVITVGGAVGSICAWEVSHEKSQWWEESGTFIARLGPDGSLDSQFGSSGLVSTHGRCKREAGDAGESFSGLVQPSPESVMALVGHTEDNTWRFRTYSSTGALSEVQAPSEGEPPVQVAMIDDHYIVLSAHYYFGFSEVLRKFTSQGIPDPTFGINGRVAMPMTCGSGPGCFAALPDGRILVAGGLVFGGQVGVRRYLADGSPDDSFGVPPWFGGGGYAWAELPGGNELDTVNKLLVLHGQPLVVGAEQVPGTGYADNQTALTLFQSDGGLSSNPPPPEPGEGTSGSDGGGSGGSGPSLGSGNNGGSTGATYGPAQSGSGPASASTNTIDAALNVMLSPHGRVPTILSLLKTGGYSLNFDAPGAGTLSVRWMSTSILTSHHTKGKAKPILVASGAETFGAAGHGTVKLHLTASGRKLLRGSRTLRLATTAIFRPIGGTAVTRQGALTIRAGQRTQRH